MVVGLSGYYGLHNAGDEAILEAIIQQLKLRGHEALVFSASPQETEQRYQVASVRRSNLLEVWRALGRTDLLLSGGGGLLQDKSSSKSLLYYLGVIRLARLQKKPVWIFNQSLGPLSPRGQRWTRLALPDVRAIWRDQSSQGYAERLGLDAGLGADPALLLRPPLVRRDKHLVVLVPRYGYMEANHKLMLTAHILQQEGYQVMALGLQPGRDEEALAMFPDLAGELTADPRRALFWFAQAGYVLSLRLHGLILSAAAGTPAAGLAYDPKLNAFATESAMPVFPLPGKTEILASLVRAAPSLDQAKTEALKRRALRSFETVLGEVRPAQISGP